MSGGGGGGGKRRGHEEEHEEHENHERWLVSYADMMTLMMVLFIVMFAISQVDSRKFAALKNGLAEGFGAPVEILTGGNQLLDPGGGVAPDDPNLAGANGNESPEQAENKISQVDPQKVAELAEATMQAQVRQEVENLQKARDELQKALDKSGLRNGANFRFDERGLVVTIATDNVLFRSGDAELLPRGQRILLALGPTLRKLPNQLSIDGHTNSIPIRNAQFSNNWELSGKRASNVLTYLHTRDKIPYNRMTFTGYAETQPRLPDRDPRSVVVNRRVEIIVEARVDNSAGRTVEKLGNETTASAGR